MLRCKSLYGACQIGQMHGGTGWAMSIHDLRTKAEEPTGLPAFLMAPARPAPPAEPSPAPEPEAAAEETPAAKPRRRRRPRFESAADEGSANTSPADVPTE